MANVVVIPRWPLINSDGWCADTFVIFRQEFVKFVAVRTITQDTRILALILSSSFFFSPSSTRTVVWNKQE